MNESAKKIAVGYTDELWNRKNLAAVDKYVDEEVFIHSLLGNFKGKKALLDVAETWLQGFPDLKVEYINIFTDHDLVCIQWKAFGTHKGEFKGKQPKDKKVIYSGATIYRVKNDKIIEYWAYTDMQHLLNQL